MRIVAYLLTWVVLAIVLLLCGNERVIAAPDWTKTNPTVISSAKNPYAISGWSRCSGMFQEIEINGYSDTVNACVYGGIDGIRLAQHYTGGSFAYSVAFQGYGAFYELRGICVSHTACMYGQEADAIVSHASAGLSHAVVHQQVSKKLKRKYDILQGRTYFQYESSDAPLEVRADSLAPYAETFAVSNGGGWGVVELRGYGIVRVNLKTGEMKRVYAPGFSYGFGFDPIAELAITDDGSHIAIVGQNLGIDVYRVGDGCGDKLTVASSVHLLHGSIPCVRAPIDHGVLFPQFKSAHAPKFIDNDSKLSLGVKRGPDAYSAVIGINHENNTQKSTYLALGDSFTSGEGELDDSFYKFGTNVGAHKCHLSSRAYPFLLGSIWNVTHKSVACSGARTLDITGSSAYKGQGDILNSIGGDSLDLVRSQALAQDIPGVVAQQAFVAQYQPSVISIGVGGNDAGLMGKLAVCIMESTCSWAKNSDTRAAAAAEIRAIYPSLREMYQKIKQVAPTARVLAIGYPSVINVNSTAVCGFVLSTVLNDAERRFIDEALTLLNQVIKTAAHAENIEFIDIQDALVGSRLCESGAKSGMSAIRLGDDIAPLSVWPKVKVFGAESFHPTPEGHKLIARKILEAVPLVATGDGCHCNTGTATLRSITPSSYWNAENTPFRLVAINNSETYAQVPQNRQLTTEIKRYTFTPNEAITVHFDAPGHKNRTIQADDEGGVRFVTEIDESVPNGFYEMRIEGDAYDDGKKLVAYGVVGVMIANEDAPADSSVNTAAATSSVSRSRDVSVHLARGIQTNFSEEVSSVPMKQGVLGRATPKSERYVAKSNDSTTPIGYIVLLSGATVLVTGVVVYQIFRLRRSRQS